MPWALRWSVLVERVDKLDGDLGAAWRETSGSRAALELCGQLGGTQCHLAGQVVADGSGERAGVLVLQLASALIGGCRRRGVPRQRVRDEDQVQNGGWEGTGGGAHPRMMAYPSERNAPSIIAFIRARAARCGEARPSCPRPPNPDLSELQSTLG